MDRKSLRHRPIDLEGEIKHYRKALYYNRRIVAGVEAIGEILYFLIENRGLRLPESPNT